MPAYDSIEYFTTNLPSADGDFVWSLPDFPNVTVERKIFRGGPSDGVELFVLSNGSLSVYVMPTRGMGIWKVEVNQGNDSVRVGWKSPVPFPVNPRNVPLDQPDGLGWLRGFNEFVARCGLESNGAPEFNANGTLRFGLHGRIQNTPAFSVRLEADAEKKEVRLTGRMFEGRLFFNTLELESTLTVPFEGATFRVDDVVKNQAARPAEIELLYHVNTGNPVANGGARMEIPFERLVPRCPWAAKNLETVAELHAPVTGEPEMCYYYELAADADGNTQTFLRNAAGDFGVTLAFSRKEFPFFCQWKAQHAAQDGYVTGMEPCINFPNSRAFEHAHGRVAVLEPNSSRHFGITFRFSTTPEQVAASSAAVAQLQASIKDPIVENAPNPDWCE
ncbi:MAG: aldose 1-epimerase family protein [Thermoguttaceae bacterium]|nr:aldose 1-epimerase family protein [Thermoguttaceae bacterium]